MLDWLRIGAIAPGVSALAVGIEAGGRLAQQVAVKPAEARNWIGSGGNVSPRMNPQASDRLHFDVQIAYARPVIALLAALCLLELHPAKEVERPLAFLIGFGK